MVDNHNINSLISVYLYMVHFPTILAYWQIVVLKENWPFQFPRRFVSGLGSCTHSVTSTPYSAMLGGVCHICIYLHLHLQMGADLPGETAQGRRSFLLLQLDRWHWTHNSPRLPGPASSLLTYTSHLDGMKRITCCIKCEENNRNVQFKLDP